MAYKSTVLELINELVKRHDALGKRIDEESVKGAFPRDLARDQSTLETVMMCIYETARRLKVKSEYLKAQEALYKMNKHLAIGYFQRQTLWKKESPSPSSTSM